MLKKVNYLVGDTGTQKSVFNKPSAFWITIDGSRSYWWYKPQGGGSNKDRAQTYSDLFQANEAITQGDGVGPATSKPTEERAKCERHHGQSCSRFARGRYVRWDNGINPKGQAAKFKSKMSENDIKIKLKNLGFYNNTISLNEFSNSGWQSLNSKEEVNCPFSFGFALT